MKKIFALALAAAMSISLLAGCGAKEEPAPAPAPAPAPEASTPAEPATEGGIPRTITLADGTVYPKGTVTFIAPFAAGGGVDLGIRLFTKYAQEYTDGTLIVENITGGSGLVGIQNGMGRKADGHTFWHIDTGTQYVTTTNSVCPFDPMEAEIFLGQLVADDRCWVMAADEDRFTNAEEFLAYVKANPGEISVATSGNATISGCSTLYMADVAGIELNPVSFSGSADAKAAFLGGHCDIMAAGISEAAPMLKEGLAKVIFTMTDDRLDMEGFQDAPTCKEMGIDVISTSTNRGLACHKDTDPAIVEYWNSIMEVVMADPEFQAEAANLSLVTCYRDTKEFTALAEEQFALWYDIKEGAGL